MPGIDTDRKLKQAQEDNAFLGAALQSVLRKLEQDGRSVENFIYNTDTAASGIPSEEVVTWWHSNRKRCIRVDRGEPWAF